ncbi:MAG: hypothetical protein KAG61_01920, partial [Bacteriovoracaceae bacterium]|nr:hypothetical protein [Bacteriovoracaceae bacterium]
PPLQNTAYADEILKAEYESLTAIGTNGEVAPLVAKSWTVSDDRLEYTFNIDNTKKFSDGTLLNAFDVKRSWEKGLSLSPIIASSGLKDALSFTEGFDDFSRTGILSGVIAKNDHQLIVRLKTPYRLFLSFLSGSRYAIYRIGKDGEYLGTGKYRINEIDHDNLRLEPRQPNRSTPAIVIKYVKTEKKSTEEQLHAIESGYVDVIQHASGIHRQQCSDSKTVRCLVGSAQTHVNLFLNVTKKSILHSPKARQALQYIIGKHFEESLLPSRFSLTFKKSLQSFLELSPGHLNDNEFGNIWNKGKEFIEYLQVESKKSPLVVQGTIGGDWLVDILSKYNIKTSSDSNTMSWNQLRTDGLTQKVKVDIAMLAVSVGDSDPDGIYHFIGKQGGLSSPFFCDGSIEDKFIYGKSLLHREEIDSHYREISKDLLTNVPYVHLGFLHRLDLYNHKRVSITAHTGKRTTNVLETFQLNL